MRKKWYQIACAICRVKVTPYGDDTNDPDPRQRYFCHKCDKDVYDVLSKFYLSLRVTDDTDEEISVLLFDKLAEKFTNSCANDLYQRLIEQDPAVLPVELTQLRGKKCLLKLLTEDKSVKQGFNPYVVEVYSDKEDDISSFEDIDYQTEKPFSITNTETTPLMICGSEATSEASSLTPVSKRNEPILDEHTPKTQGSVTKKKKIEESE